MNILFCTHCGYKDNFTGDCPKCGCKVIRNLSTDLYCADCLNLKTIRDKEGLWNGEYHCPFKDGFDDKGNPHKGVQKPWSYASGPNIFSVGYSTCDGFKIK
jgi:hypothetical protein